MLQQIFLIHFSRLSSPSLGMTVELGDAGGLRMVADLELQPSAHACESRQREVASAGRDDDREKGPEVGTASFEVAVAAAHAGRNDDWARGRDDRKNLRMKAEPVLCLASRACRAPFPRTPFPRIEVPCSYSWRLPRS